MSSKKNKKNKTSDSDYVLDGRTLEGGGQLLRLALSLSALTGKALDMSNIRGSRHGGGLKAQHLACVQWLAQACNAQTQGADIKSQRLLFRPGVQTTIQDTCKRHDSSTDAANFSSHIDIGSPGSIALVLQAVLPFILFSPPARCTDAAKRPSVELVISGGTNVTKSPSYEYLTQVLFPTLALIGLPAIESTLHDRGWSTGSTCMGSATFTIPTLVEGEKLPAFTLEPPDDIEGTEIKPRRITATFIAPEQMWSEFRERLLLQLEELFSLSSDDVQVKFEDSKHPKRVYMIVVATIVHGDSEFRLGSDELLEGFGRKRKAAVEEEENVVGGMVHRVIKTLADDVRSGACVDRHMVDQLVVFQALAEGKSHVWRGMSLMDGQALGQSLHAETAEWISIELVGARLRNGRGRGVGHAASSIMYCGTGGDVYMLKQHPQIC